MKLSNDVASNLGTLSVRAGEKDYLLQGATQMPVVHSVSFGYPDVDQWLQVALGEKPGHIYSRNTNPTVSAFEDKVRQLEGAEAATSIWTGMAAISNTLFTFLSPGIRVVSVKDTYGGTNKIFLEFLPRFNIDATLCDTTDHQSIEAEIAAKQMQGFGGLLSFTLKDGSDAVRSFLPRLSYAHLAANLGAVETVVAPPATTSHVGCTFQERAAMGIPEGLIRYSAGIEGSEDLVADLRQALTAIQ